MVQLLTMKPIFFYRLLNATQYDDDMQLPYIVHQFDTYKAYIVRVNFRSVTLFYDKVSENVFMMILSDKIDGKIP